MRYLTLGEVLEIQRRVLHQTGGSPGVRDLAALESALAQPRITFEGRDLYPTVIEKASALMFSLVENHGFVDGNKRTGHAAGEVFLLLNGYELEANVEEQECVMLELASGVLGRDGFTQWLGSRAKPKRS